MHASASRSSPRPVAGVGGTTSNQYKGAGVGTNPDRILGVRAASEHSVTLTPATREREMGDFLARRLVWDLLLGGHPQTPGTGTKLAAGGTMGASSGVRPYWGDPGPGAAKPQGRLSGHPALSPGKYWGPETTGACSRFAVRWGSAVTGWETRSRSRFVPRSPPCRAPPGPGVFDESDVLLFNPGSLGPQEPGSQLWCSHPARPPVLAGYVYRGLGCPGLPVVDTETFGIDFLVVAGGDPGGAIVAMYAHEGAAGRAILAQLCLGAAGPRHRPLAPRSGDVR